MSQRQLLLWNKILMPWACRACAVTTLFQRMILCVCVNERTTCMCNFSFFPYLPENLLLHLHSLRSTPFLPSWNAIYALLTCTEKIQSGICCSLEYKGLVDNCGSSSRLSNSVVVTELFTQPWFRHASMLDVPQMPRWDESWPVLLHSTVLPGSCKDKAAVIG